MSTDVRLSLDAIEKRVDELKLKVFTSGPYAN